LRSIGCVDTTERKFYKGKHFQNKIIEQNDNRVILFTKNNPENNTYTPLKQMGYADEFLKKMIDAITKTTYNSRIFSTSDGVDF
jgi:hypothetical protein